MTHLARAAEKRKPASHQKFIPNDIETMMKHLLYLTRTQHFVKQIGSVRPRQTASIRNDMECFKQIFSMKPSNLEAANEQIEPRSPIRKMRRSPHDYRVYLRKRIEWAQKSKLYSDGKAKARREIKAGQVEPFNMPPAIKRFSLPYIDTLMNRSESTKLIMSHKKHRHRSLDADFI